MPFILNHRYLQADGLRMGSSGSFQGSVWSRSRLGDGCAFFFLAYIISPLIGLRCRNDKFLCFEGKNEYKKDAPCTDVLEMI